MNGDQQLSVARIALAACGERGYALAGNLALHVHRVTGVRDADDVDIFVNQLIDDADTVRQDVAATLTAAGYHVETAATWGYHPDATSRQNGELLISHPDHGSTTLQMVCVTRYLKPVDRDGMPVTAIGECLYRKIEAVQNRLEVKDFIDLVLLHTHMGQRNADRYIDMYVNGIAQHEGRPQAELSRDLYQALAQVSQIPDMAFAAYGYDNSQAVQLRTTILAWADRLAPQLNPMSRDPAIASGRTLMTHQDAQAALARMACNPPLTRLSDQQLSTWRAEVTTNLLRAVSGQGKVEEAQQQLQPISSELARRAELTPHERAAEDAVRRAEEAESMAGRDPARLGPHGVLDILAPPPPKRPPQTAPYAAPLHGQHTQPQRFAGPGRQP